MPPTLSSAPDLPTSDMKTWCGDPHATWHHPAWAAMLFVLMLLLSPIARAHTEFGSQIDVDHALIEARDNMSGVLKFRIHNNTGSVIHLLRVETPIASGSRIMFDAGDGRQLQLDSLGVKPEQVLDFTTSHMWVELTGLRETLRNGMHVPLRLIFNAGQWVDITGDVGTHHDH